MIAEIISIGDELLIGQTVNTNATWMGSLLNAEGFRVGRVITISDDANAITSALEESLQRASLVLITGGLGPTKDDITKKTLADYFGMQLVLDMESLNRVRSYFEGRGLKMLPVNEAQALVPDGSIILHNLRGTANGMWFEKEGKIVISMPGVPYEMEYLMQEEVIPRVRSFFKRPAIVHRTILTTGVGESFLADKISTWEDSLASENIYLAYLPSPGMVKLRMSAYGGKSESELRAAIARKEEELKALIHEYIYGFDDDTLSSVVGKLLKEKQATIAVAESCTGGMIAHMMTSTPGSSAYFLGGLITYKENIKASHLGVPQEVIQEFSVYSEQVARSMAESAVKTFGANYAISTTGVAGPSDDGDVKVGTIWIAAANEKRSVCVKLLLGKSRERNILMASNAALNLLRKEFLVVNL